MPDAQVTQIEPVNKQFGITTVTNSNLKQFVDEKLGVPPPPSTEEMAAKAAQEAEAQKQQDAEVEKKAEEDPTHDVPEVPKDKKSKLNERFSKLTTQRKEAEAKAQSESERAAKFETELKILREEREKLAKEASELKSKYEPPKKDLEEPKLEQFRDVHEYAKALKDYVADQTRKEDAAKQVEAIQKKESEERTKQWSERVDKFKSDTKDYDDVIRAELSDVNVPNVVIDSIYKSDVGPQVLYYLAKNKDIALKLSTMPLDDALKQIGKLEDKVIKSEVKEEKKEEPKAKISKAPPPITPIVGGTSTGTSMIDSNNNFTGSYEDWKRLRSQGKV